MTARPDETAPDSAAAPPASATDGEASPIQPIQARERLRPQVGKKIRLRDDIVHGEKKMEAVVDDHEPAPLEPATETTTATAGTWSRAGAPARMTPADAAYHAKVRRNQIFIEQAADGFRITIWLMAFGLIFPAVMVFTATGMLGWARLLYLPVLAGSGVALFGLYHRNCWPRRFALSWSLALLGWYLLQPVLVCTGILIEEPSGSDVFFLGFVYLSLAAGTVLTPIWRIRRSEWELGLLDAALAAEKPAPAPAAAEEIEAEAGWDEADDSTPPPPV